MQQIPAETPAFSTARSTSRVTSTNCVLRSVFTRNTSMFPPVTMRGFYHRPPIGLPSPSLNGSVHLWITRSSLPVHCPSQAIARKWPRRYTFQFLRHKGRRPNRQRRTNREGVVEANIAVQKSSKDNHRGWLWTFLVVLVLSQLYFVRELFAAFVLFAILFVAIAFMLVTFYMLHKSLELAFARLTALR